MSKSLYLIRHGYALHNELFPKLGIRAFRIKATIDAPLTHEGHLQAIDLGYSWKEKGNIELILVSPCGRKTQKRKSSLFIKIYLFSSKFNDFGASSSFLGPHGET